MAPPHVGVDAVLAPRVPFGAESPVKVGEALLAPQAPLGPFRRGAVLVPRPATAVAAPVARRTVALPPPAVVVTTAVEGQVAVVGGTLRPSACT